MVVPQESLLGPSLFNIFIKLNDFELHGTGFILESYMLNIQLCLGSDVSTTILEFVANSGLGRLLSLDPAGTEL